jgi:hypothetical protein
MVPVEHQGNEFYLKPDEAAEKVYRAEMRAVLKVKKYGVKDVIESIAFGDYGLDG